MCFSDTCDDTTDFRHAWLNELNITTKRLDYKDLMNVGAAKCREIKILFGR